MYIDLICLNNVNHARRGIYLVMVVVIFLMFLLTLIGLLMYNNYAGCDPLASGRISDSSEVNDT